MVLERVYRDLAEKSMLLVIYKLLHVEDKLRQIVKR